MNPISGTSQPPITISAARDTPAAHKSRQEPRYSSPEPVTDAYIPEEAHVPFGLYWVGRDEDGRPKIFFDDPAPKPTEDVPKEDAEPPEQPSSGRRTEQCTGNTDQVDREIKKLKERQEQLERQLRTETDETKAEALRRKLAQVESELRQKDNDAYRRQHTHFS